MQILCSLYSLACIELEEYQTAKAALETGASLAPNDSRFTKFIKECDKRIAGNFASQKIKHVIFLVA